MIRLDRFPWTVQVKTEALRRQLDLVHTIVDVKNAEALLAPITDAESPNVS
jgi:hypothetical protein